MGLEQYKIGNTSFHQSIELSDLLTTSYGRPVVYVKREDENEPCRNFKARAVAAWLEETAHLNGPLVLAAITDGNLGYAGAELCYAYGNGRRFASIVDRSLDRKTRRQMKRHGNYVIEADLSRSLTTAEIQNLVKASLRDSRVTVIPVGNIDTSGNGYKRIAYELYDAGVRKDWRAYVPAGGLDLLTNMVWGFEERGEVPQFVACTIPQNVFGEKIEDVRSPAEKLVAAHSLLETAGRDIIQKYDILLHTITSREILESLDMVRNKVHIPTSPSSAPAYAGAFRDAKEGRIRNGQRIVIINTGYDEARIPSRISYFEALRTVRIPQIIGTAALLALTISMDGANPILKSIRNQDSTQFFNELYLGMLKDSPFMNPQIAYAVYRGSGKIDNAVLSHLLQYSAYGQLDNEMCTKSPECMKDVEDYQRWLREQEKHYGVRLSFERVPDEEREKK